MTNKELSQLYWLNREIEADKQRLAELRSALKITGLPHVGDENDIKYLEKLIKLKTDQTVVEYERLIRYIDTIDDSLVRQVMSLRHINGLSWDQVAAHVGGGNTHESVRLIHYRYLKKHK